jgi:hypothetical protein
MMLTLAVAPAAAVVAADDAPPVDDAAALCVEVELEFEDAVELLDEPHALTAITATPANTPVRNHIGRDTGSSFF